MSKEILIHNHQIDYSADTEYLATNITRLDAASSAGRRVSAFSEWDDPSWILINYTAGARRSKSVFVYSFSMHDGSDFHTDPKWALLLQDLRLHVWLAINGAASDRRKELKPGSIGDLSTTARYCLRWMAKRGYGSFSELNPSICSQFLDDLADDKAASDEDEGITIEAISRYLDFLVRLFEQSSPFPDGSSAAMKDHPFLEEAALSVARKVTAKVCKAILAVPDELFCAAMTEAGRWLGAPAEDLGRLSNIYWDTISKHPPDNSNSYSSHINSAIDGFVFDNDGRLTTPWAPPITSSRLEQFWSARGNRDYEKTWFAMDQYRHLFEDCRDAGTVLCQGLIGMRVSEVAGLQALPRNEESGWPYCLTTRLSISGLNELFIVRGRVFKGRDRWDYAEWVAGSRPAGTDYLPLAVQAILMLDKLYRRWREFGCRTDLIVQFPGGGFPVERSSVRSITSDIIRLGQKEFVRKHVKSPPQYINWNLTTHQWRKSFAQYIVRSDANLKLAVSDHFHHLSLAMLEEGYLGNDVALNDFIDDVVVRATAEAIHAAVTNNGGAGRMGELLSERRDEIMAFMGISTPKENQIDRLVELLLEDDTRVWGTDWGDCLFRGETAKCCRRTTGQFDIRARRPNPARRNASICSGCRNLLVSKEHEKFWRSRYESNLKNYQANFKAGLYDVLPLSGARVRASASILRRMGVVVMLPDALNDQ